MKFKKELNEEIEMLKEKLIKEINSSEKSKIQLLNYVTNDCKETIENIEYKKRVFKNNLFLLFANICILVLLIILFLAIKYCFHSDLNMFNIICLCILTCCTYLSFVEAYKVYVDIEFLEDKIVFLKSLKDSIIENINEE